MNSNKKIINIMHSIPALKLSVNSQMAQEFTGRSLALFYYLQQSHMRHAIFVTNLEIGAPKSLP